jgi:UPF0271 protein
VPEVKKELIAGSMPWMRFNAAIENRKLTVRSPKDSFFQHIQEASRKVGDMRYLSEADLQVLALALELKGMGLSPVIVTDEVDVEFTSLMTFGIKFRFKWILYCPACFRKYPSDYKFKVCEVCGTELKRKPKKKTRL